MGNERFDMEINGKHNDIEYRVLLEFGIAIISDVFSDTSYELPLNRASGSCVNIMPDCAALNLVGDKCSLDINRNDALEIQRAEVARKDGFAQRH